MSALQKVLPWLLSKAPLVHSILFATILYEEGVGRKKTGGGGEYDQSICSYVYENVVMKSDS